MERTLNGVKDKQNDRIRRIAELADLYLAAYKIRNPDSATFAEYALRHVKRLLGEKMQAEISDKIMNTYQTERLSEKAAPKSINDEVGFVLRLLEDQGDVIRAKMRTMESLRLDDSIEDILITLSKQYHLVRLLKSSRSDQGLFLYLVLDRGKANLALARHSLKRIEGDIAI